MICIVMCHLWWEMGTWWLFNNSFVDLNRMICKILLPLLLQILIEEYLLHLYLFAKAFFTLHVKINTWEFINFFCRKIKILNSFLSLCLLLLLFGWLAKQKIRKLKSRTISLQRARAAIGNVQTANRWHPVSKV